MPWAPASFPGWCFISWEQGSPVNRHYRLSELPDSWIPHLTLGVTIKLSPVLISYLCFPQARWRLESPKLWDTWSKQQDGQWHWDVPLSLGTAMYLGTNRPLSQGPQFFSEFYENMQREKGNFPDRFSAQQFRDTRSELNVSSLELRDSALYLCARSLAQPCWVPHVLCTNLPALAWALRERAASHPGFPPARDVFSRFKSTSCYLLSPEHSQRTEPRLPCVHWLFPRLPAAANSIEGRQLSP